MGYDAGGAVQAAVQALLKRIQLHESVRGIRREQRASRALSCIGRIMRFGRRRKPISLKVMGSMMVMVFIQLQLLVLL